jgi:hypothetical protein
VAGREFGGLNSVRDGTDGVIALDVGQFLSLGIVRLDDMAINILGMFLVINGLSDIAVGMISVTDRLGDMSTMVLQCRGFSNTAWGLFSTGAFLLTTWGQ